MIDMNSFKDICETADDLLTEVFAQMANNIAKQELEYVIRGWSETTEFPVGFYKNLRKHGIHIHKP